MSRENWQYIIQNLNRSRRAVHAMSRRRHHEHYLILNQKISACGKPNMKMKRKFKFLLFKIAFFFSAGKFLLQWNHFCDFSSDISFSSTHKISGYLPNFPRYSKHFFYPSRCFLFAIFSAIFKDNWYLWRAGKTFNYWLRFGLVSVL